jgi:hypothetical protein
MKLLISLFTLYISSNYLIAQTDSTEATPKEPSWEKSFGLGLSLSHALNVNPPAGSTPQSGFSSNNSLDASLNYIKESSRLKIRNDFNWVTTFFRANTSSQTQNNSDVFNINHDVSYTFKKGGDWNLNLIMNESTPILTVFDNNYLKDLANTGSIQQFWNPYSITLSPGVKYQPNKYLGISVSPYSMLFRGVTVQAIANKDLHFQDIEGHIDSLGQYKTRFANTQGAATNIWYTRLIKKKLDIKYKLALSTNYFENLFKNGKINGQFLTTFNVFKGFSIAHKAFLKGNLEQKPLKLNYNQVILLGYNLRL